MVLNRILIIKFNIQLKSTILNKISVLIFLVVFLSGSCKKEHSVSNGRTISGTINLEVHAIHHTWDVSGVVTYLKKNAIDFPGKDSSIYDFKGIADGYGKYTFEKLFPGNYYVYVSGFDSLWGSNVVGYLPVILSTDDLNDNYKELTVSVSE